MIDHDRLFKELISTFFIEFLALFLPEVRAYLEEGSLEFLDKELFSDIVSGVRHEVDLLAKLRFKQEDAFFLVHVENQAQPQANFGKRMHAYFARLHEKHNLPVYPIAVFAYDSPLTEQSGVYIVEFPDWVVLEFRYRVIQLNQLNWRDFARKENPVASALMAKMRIAPEDRARVKLECMRMIASLRLNKAKTHLVLGFVDTYLRLSQEEKNLYEAELEKLDPPEKEKVMETRMSWREEALQEGLEQGLKQGLQQAMSWKEEALQEGKQQGIQEGKQQGIQETKHRLASLVMHLAEKRLGQFGAGIRERIGQLDSDQLEDLGEAVLDFERVEQLATWLDDTKSC
ncbi:MAG TPA: DUF4351 domain-containing protein [Blastocatellia bacterium]|nr:DUF4351 domain-containing protein [Blastocatellia bacterium]